MVETTERQATGFFTMNKNSLRLSRITLWSLVAIYTFALPYVIVVYRAIETHFSKEIAGKVPLIMILFLGVVYTSLGFMMKKGMKFMGPLVPCGIIAFILISLESNPNKQIHIPEYILLSWLVFQVLVLDYRGRGIFILVFLITSMLGVVDELAQGIHPDRFYGWWDMVINTASASIGVILLTGLSGQAEGSWGWTSGLKKKKGLMGTGLLGILGTVLGCVYLFKVKATGDFWGAYPVWLLGWNGLFTVLIPVAMFYFYFGYARRRPVLNDRDYSNHYADQITGCLWVFPFLAILFIINTIILFVALSGCLFT